MRLSFPLSGFSKNLSVKPPIFLETAIELLFISLAEPEAVLPIEPTSWQNHKGFCPTIALPSGAVQMAILMWLENIQPRFPFQASTRYIPG